MTTKDAHVASPLELASPSEQMRCSLFSATHSFNAVHSTQLVQRSSFNAARSTQLVQRSSFNAARSTQLIQRSSFNASLRLAGLPTWAQSLLYTCFQFLLFPIPFVCVQPPALGLNSFSSSSSSSSSFSFLPCSPFKKCEFPLFLSSGSTASALRLV